MNIEIVCVDNKNTEMRPSISSEKTITIGKIYLANKNSFYETHVRIINDFGEYTTYSTDRFIALSKYRESQLNKIGI